MNKFFRIVLIIVIVISALFMCGSIGRLIQMRNGEIADCTITFIGLPDGAVFGDFTDSDGVEHVNEFLYLNGFLQGDSADVEKYYGTHIKIMYDKESEEIINYGYTVTSTLVGTALILVSVVILWIMKLKGNSNSKRTAQREQLNS